MIGEAVLANRRAGHQCRGCIEHSNHKQKERHAPVEAFRSFFILSTAPLAVACRRCGG
jgi:ribosomal protein L37E